MYLRAEHQHHERGRRGNRRQPQEPDGDPEGYAGDRGRGQQDEDRDRHRPAEIDPGQQPTLRHPRREPAGAKRPEGVGEPDHRKGPAADRRGEAGVLEIGRQMRGDEGQLEAAGEEPEHKEHKGPVPERLGQRLTDRLVGNRRRAGRGRRAAARTGRERHRERQHQENREREHHQRLMPPHGVRSARCRWAETGIARTSRRPCPLRRPSAGAPPAAAWKTRRARD